MTLKGSPQQRPGIKCTADAANLKNAPRKQRTATTVIMQLLCYGVKPNNWVNMVKYMVVKPQSCLRAFVLRCWFGKDDATNVRSAPRAAARAAVGGGAGGGEA